MKSKSLHNRNGEEEEDDVVDNDDDNEKKDEELMRLCTPLPVSSPIFIMSTSGTTGSPKVMEQGYGVLLNQVSTII
tara:strand:+ start:283 stop:510 length:228 start_codon:yes stop_codon:yes gene_type:complete